MKYGFIGCGNMGGAIAKALSKSTTDIMLSARSSAKKLSADLGCCTGSNESVVSECCKIFLAVKPQVMKSVLEPLNPLLAQKKPLIITMAAGITISQIEAMCGCRLPVIRIMPNTPVAVGRGMITYCTNDMVTANDLNDFLSDMQHAGRLDCIPEALMDAASSVSGCGPAFMYMFLEAMADGGVACGLPREKALDYAAATMAGAAEMYMQTKAHPGTLKDSVCSPGGSTIEGVKVLEESGFRGAVIDCITAAYKRNTELGK